MKHLKIVCDNFNRFVFGSELISEDYLHPAGAYMIMCTGSWWRKKENTILNSSKIDIHGGNLILPNGKPRLIPHLDSSPLPAWWTVTWTQK